MTQTMTQTMTPRVTRTEAQRTTPPRGPARLSLSTPRTQAPARGKPVHLTRRGRSLVVVTMVAVLLGAFSLGRTASQAAPEAAPSRPVEVATVQAGDSLWSVAERIAPDHDTRQVMAQIRRLNDLTGSELRIGQQLLLPVAA